MLHLLGEKDGHFCSTSVMGGGLNIGACLMQVAAFTRKLLHPSMVKIGTTCYDFSVSDIKFEYGIYGMCLLYMIANISQSTKNLN